MPKISQVLRSSKDAILRDWEQEVRNSIYASRSESTTSLRDSIPELIDDLVQALELGMKELKPEIIRFAHHHGAERAHLSHFSIEDAISEYNILRRIIFTTLEASLDISSLDRDIIFEGINLGIAKAGAEYVKLQLDAQSKTNEQLTILNRYLRQSEERFRSFLDLLPSFAWRITPTGEAEYFSRYFETYTGLPVKEGIRARGYAQVIHPDDLVATDEILSKAREDKSSFNIIQRIRRRDGEYRWHLAKGSPMLDARGALSGWIGTTIDIHDQMNAEEALKTSEEKFKSLFLNAPVAIAEVDPETRRFKQINPAYCKMLGYTEEELLQLRIEDVTHPEDIDDDISKMKEITLGRKTGFRKEKRYLKKDKSVIWAEVSVTTYQNKFGDLESNIAVALDVTERMLAEEKIKESSKLLKKITDIQPTLISYLDKDQIYRFVNHTYKSWFEKEVDEIVGHHIKNVVGPKAYTQILKELEKAITGEEIKFEKVIPYPTGERFVHIIYNPDRMPDGSIKGIFVSVEDKSEERAYLESLRSSEQQFVSLANSIPQLAWMADPSGSIFWYNKRWYEFTGHNFEEMKGDGWQKVHHPDYVDKVKENYFDSIHKGVIWEDTFPLKSSQGEWRWFLSRAMPIKDDTGKISRWFGTNTDITDQKKITDSLNEEQILRDKFVSTLTHDLKTPLTAAKMNAELIKRKSLDIPISNLAYRISENISRADRMIEDLLDASKIRAGQVMVPDLQHIDLIQVTRSTLDDLIAIHGDRFTYEGPDRLEAYLCPQGIRRIIENLCNNAIKYGSPTERVLISIRLDHEMILLRVKNFGHPLMTIDREKLFEPFVRGEASDIVGKKGWGIGLTIVKGLTEAHQGEISIETSEESTTFKILLPRHARSFRGSSSYDDLHP